MKPGTLSNLPKYAVVAQRIREAIRDGRYAPGTPLPGRRQLADLYGAAPLTIQAAIDQLVSERVVRTQKGCGTFIAESDATLPKNIGLIGILARAWNDNWDNANENSICLHAAERAVNEYGGATTVVNLHRKDNSLMSLAEGVRRLCDQDVTGIMIVQETPTPEIEEVDAALPIVFANSVTMSLPISTAYFDNEYWGQVAARHLIERGCRRLVFFSPYSAAPGANPAVNSTWIEERLNGARIEAASAEGVAIESIVDDVSLRDALPTMFAQPDQYFLAARAFASRLSAGDLMFDGVIAANDRIALGFESAMRERGLIPGIDYRLIGFDNSPEARAAGISSLQPPFERLGREAIALLVRLLRGEPGPIFTRVGAHVIARRSTLLMHREPSKSLLTYV